MKHPETSLHFQRNEQTYRYKKQYLLSVSFHRASFVKIRHHSISPRHSTNTNKNNPLFIHYSQIQTTIVHNNNQAQSQLYPSPHSSKILTFPQIHPVEGLSIGGLNSHYTLTTSNNACFYEVGGLKQGE